MTKKKFWENREAEFGELFEINKEVRESILGTNIRLCCSKSAATEIKEIYNVWKIPYEELVDDNIYYLVTKKL